MHACWRAVLVTLSLSVLPATGVSGATDPVAVVNGIPIPQARFDYRLRHRPESQADSAAYRAQLREALIREEILVQEAHREGIDRDKQELLDWLRDMILVRAYIDDELQIRALQTDEERRRFKWQTEARAMDSETDRRQVAAEAIRRSLDQSAEVQGEIDRQTRGRLLFELNAAYIREVRFAPPEDRLRAEYEKLKTKNGEPGTVRYNAHHILVDNEPLARAILAKLRGGADFTALAAKESRDEATRHRGGELHWVDANAFDQPFADALRTLGRGELSGPIRTRQGWHIIRLDGAITAKPFPPFADWRKVLETQYRADLYENRTARLRASAKIE